MNRKILFWPLAAMLLTACEKTLEVGEDVFPAEQVKNSLLQVRTRGGGSGDEATVAYPVTVYVFAGDECRAAQTIGDEGQTLNIALVEGTYSVYAVGGASATDYLCQDNGKIVMKIKRLLILMAVRCSIVSVTWKMSWRNAITLPIGGWISDIPARAIPLC